MFKKFHGIALSFALAAASINAHAGPFTRPDLLTFQAEKKILDGITVNLDPEAQHYFVGDGNHEDVRIAQIFLDLIPDFQRLGVKYVYLEIGKEDQPVYDKIIKGEMSLQEYLNLFSYSGRMDENDVFAITYRKLVYQIMQEATKAGMTVLCNDVAPEYANELRIKNEEATRAISQFLAAYVFDDKQFEEGLKGLPYAQVKENVIGWLAKNKPDLKDSYIHLTEKQYAAYAAFLKTRVDDTIDTQFIFETSKGEKVAVLRGDAHASVSEQSMLSLLRQQGKTNYLQLYTSAAVKKEIDASAIECTILGIADCGTPPDLEIDIDARKVTLRRVPAKQSVP
jgi:hypothetical protein